jgi:WXXGXW repeat (2 copies)
MKTRQNTLLVTLSLASALLLPGMALGGSDIFTDVAPPPPRAERVPPRDGYVWAPGYWEWTGRFYRWVSGSYVYERRRAHWVPDHWDQVGNRWHYVRGHWDSERSSAPLRASSGNANTSVKPPQ